MALAHVVGDKVEAAYRRGDLFQKRRALAQAWALNGERVERRLAAIFGGDVDVFKAIYQMPARTPPSRQEGCEFLEWVKAKPRTMDDVLHEWFDTYPRCDAAEEAIGKRLVKIEDGYLILTSKGVSVLDNGSENTSASLPWPLPSPRTPAGVLTASVAQSEELSPGDSFGARFVEKVLGRGGMGVTYLLRDDHGAPIVLKSILPDRLKNIKTIQSLYNEISMLLKIPPHQNITQVRYAGLDNNIPYLFLDYIPGGDLWCFCKEQRRLSTSECWWVLLNIVHGLAVLSQNDILHLDLKPQNLLIDEDGFVRLADFGLARSISNHSHDFESNDMSAVQGAGTPQFMSPEQLRDSGIVDARADIWATGVCMYWLTTGVLPFDGSTMRELREQILAHKPPPPITLNTDVDQHLNDIIMKCIEKDQTSRYRNSRELGYDVTLAVTCKMSPSPLFFLQNEPFTGEKIISAVAVIFDVVERRFSGTTPEELTQAPDPDRAPDGSDWLSYVQRIQNLLTVYNLPEAEKLIVAGLSHDPEEPVILTQEAALLARLGQHERAMASFDRVLDHHDSKGRRAPALAYKEAIMLGLLTDNLDWAESVLLKARGRWETEADPQYRQHLTSTIQPQIDELAQTKDLYETLSGDETALRRIQSWRFCTNALELAKRGLWHPALVLFRLATVKDPSFAGGWSGTGFCLMELKQYEEASEALSEAIRLFPSDAATWLHRGRIALRLGRFAVAIEAFGTAAKLGDAHASYWIGKCNSEVKAFPPRIELEPADWIEISLARFNESAMDHFLGMPQGSENGVFELKVVFARDMVKAELNVDSREASAPPPLDRDRSAWVRALCGRANTLIRKGEYAAALPFFRDALTRDPTYGWGWSDLGACLLQMGEASDAVEALKRAVFLMPMDHQAITLLGVAFVRDGQFIDARDCLRRAVKIDPESSRTATLMDEITRGEGRI